MIKIPIRQPIVCVLGHIDHGKTTLLDYVRGTTVAVKEAGRITQHIGATEVPVETITSICGSLIQKIGVNLTIPGLLFIDTPGHDAFTNLRRRGGSIADMALLIVDIMQGIQPQTIEAIEILRSFKTPFIVVANKIDRIQGWIPNRDACFSDTIRKQREDVQEMLDKRLYELVGALGEHGFNSERFDRVEDFTEEIIIIPASSTTGEGVPEILVYLAGLCQKFLEKRLKLEVGGPGKGSVLEVREEKGLGTTMDVIVYEGIIRMGDSIVVGGRNGPIVAKVKALLRPKPLDEIRDPREKFDSIKEVHAACGVRIACPQLEGVLAGSPLLVARDTGLAKEEIAKEVGGIKVDTDSLGVVLKADTLGTLEAALMLLKKHNIPVRHADVGEVSKHDVSVAEAVSVDDPYLGVVFAFHTRVNNDAFEAAMTERIQIFKTDIIYKLIEDYEEWVAREKDRVRKDMMSRMVFPGKVRLLPGCVFRASKPAIFGVEVIDGTIKPKYPLMREDGRIIGKIKVIQSQNESIEEATKGMQVAVSIEDVTVGRQIHEKDVLYTAVPLSRIGEIEKTTDTPELLQEIKKIREERKHEGSDS